MSENNPNCQAVSQELTITTDVPHNQRSLDKITTKILQQKCQVAQSFLEIRNLLIEAKKQLTKHGEWLKWLSSRVDISERMSQCYMQLARAFSNTTSVSDLGMTKALALLALPESRRETFISEFHEVNGEQKKVKEMSTHELKKAIRNQNETEKAFMFKPILRDDIIFILMKRTNQNYRLNLPCQVILPLILNQHRDTWIAF